MYRLGLGSKLRKFVLYIDGLEEVAEKAQRLANADDEGTSASRYTAMENMKKSLSDLDRFEYEDLFGRVDG